MKHTIIKDYKSWLFESTQYMKEAADPNTPIETLLQNTDLEGLFQRIMSTDAASKGLPNYANVMEWWHQGGPDLGLWKSLFKAGGEAKRDKVNSARSMYYWLGGFATKGRSAQSAGKANYIKNVEDFCTAVKTNAPAIVAAVNAFPKPAEKTRYAGWIEAEAKADAVLAFLQTVKAKSLNLSSQAAAMLIPYSAIDGQISVNNAPTPPATYFKLTADTFTKDKTDDNLSVTSYAYQTSQWTLQTSTVTTLQQLQTNIAALTSAMADQTKLSTYFSADNTLSAENKKVILDFINTKVQAYLERKNKNIQPGQVAMTADNAIKTATDLYISPKGTTLTLPPATKQPSPEPIVISGSYPENPNGDWNSAGAKKATQFFGDDKIQIEAGPVAEMTNGIKSYLDQIKAQGAQITGVKIWGISSTSAVPSSYDPATKGPNTGAGYTTAKNGPLAQDRLTSIKTSLRQIFTQNGVADNLITEDVAQDKVTPNIGAAWTEQDKAKFANRKQPGQEALLKEYDDKFGKYKYAFARFEITYTMTRPFTVTTQADPIPNSEWTVYINWTDETWKPPSISIPGIGFKPKSGGSQRNWGSTECPVF